jgi:hypothetical protein
MTTHKYNFLIYLYIFRYDFIVGNSEVKFQIFEFWVGRNSEHQLQIKVYYIGLFLNVIIIITIMLSGTQAFGPLRSQYNSPEFSLTGVLFSFLLLVGS